mmetsp:Transcript_46536/g.71174  ORF Transcript_46536/g.71174 Transcript_46536/m.71174 type:complete len:102 (-) Transcript_46536:2159-2464(-)
MFTGEDAETFDGGFDMDSFTCGVCLGLLGDKGEAAVAMALAGGWDGSRDISRLGDFGVVGDLGGVNPPGGNKFVAGGKCSPCILDSTSSAPDLLGGGGESG